MQIFWILFALWGKWFSTADLMWQHESRVTSLTFICQTTETESKGSILSFFCCATMYGNTKLNSEIQEITDKQHSSNMHFKCWVQQKGNNELKKIKLYLMTYYEADFLRLVCLLQFSTFYPNCTIITHTSRIHNLPTPCQVFRMYAVIHCVDTP